MATSSQPSPEPLPPGRWALALGGNAIALQELAGSYWYTVYLWWRRSGRPDAGLLTQACFTRWLREAPPEPGQLGAARLREWLPAQLTALSTAGLYAVAEPAIEIATEWAEERYAEEPEG